MNDLVVSEIFGPTVQGEGPSMGRLAYFVRLGLCNLDCSWCDTPYTWDWKGKNGPPQDRKALRHLPVADISRAVAGADLVVITGGEPMMQHRALAGLVDELHRQEHTIEIETNGTLYSPSVRADRFNVSPKLTGSGVEPARAITDNFAAYVQLARLGRAVFKFVVTDGVDLTDVDALVRRFDIPTGAVWLMPEGRDAQSIVTNVGWLAQSAIERNFNLSSRLHVLIWGDKRGV